MAEVISLHPADILAAVRKKGGTLTAISRQSGITMSLLSRALREPEYRGEQAIAAFLNVPARTIWPGRYDADGLPRHPRIRKQLIAKAGLVNSKNRPS